MTLLDTIFSAFIKNNAAPSRKKAGTVHKKPSFVRFEAIEGVNFKFKKHSLSKSIKMSFREDSDFILVTYPKRCSFKEAREFAAKNIKSAKKWLLDKKPDTSLKTLSQRRNMAKEYLPARLYELSKMYGFKYNDVRLKNVKTRWGSCSYKNNINLNINLMALDKSLIDYVLVHELCHTVHKNHGEKFWQLVLKCMPDAIERRKLLKKARV